MSTMSTTSPSKDVQKSPTPHSALFFFSPYPFFCGLMWVLFCHQFFDDLFSLFIFSLYLSLSLFLSLFSTFPSSLFLFLSLSLSLSRSLSLSFYRFLSKFCKCRADCWSNFWSIFYQLLLCLCFFFSLL